MIYIGLIISKNGELALRNVELCADLCSRTYVNTWYTFFALSWEEPQHVHEPNFEFGYHVENQLIQNFNVLEESSK